MAVVEKRSTRRSWRMPEWTSCTCRPMGCRDLRTILRIGAPVGSAAEVTAVEVTATAVEVTVTAVEVTATAVTATAVEVTATAGPAEPRQQRWVKGSSEGRMGTRALATEAQTSRSTVSSRPWSAA